MCAFNAARDLFLLNKRKEGFSLLLQGSNLFERESEHPTLPGVGREGDTHDRFGHEACAHHCQQKQELADAILAGRFAGCAADGQRFAADGCRVGVVIRLERT